MDWEKPNPRGNMKTKIAQSTLLTAAKHPRATASVAATAARNPGEAAELIRAGFLASRALRNVTQPAVRNELGAAVDSLGEAFARARKIGPISAPEDKKVAKNLDSAMDHLASALDSARGRRRRHSKLRVLVLLSVLTAGIYTLWRLSATSLTLDGTTPASLEPADS
jgi:hypothetical protein